MHQADRSAGEYNPAATALLLLISPVTYIAPFQHEGVRRKPMIRQRRDQLPGP